MKKYLDEYQGTPPLGVDGDYRCSVHFGNTYRLEKAKKEYSNPSVEVDKIILYTNEFLKKIGMKVYPKEKNICDNPMQINYKKIKEEYELDSDADIVWMKFTCSGHLGVVATSNDVNFNIPASSNDYDKKVWKYNPYKNKKERVWQYNSAGILVHQIGEHWNTSFVLIFPLKNIPNQYYRGDIERAIGNYLIYKGIPIIDFYSHNY